MIKIALYGKSGTGKSTVASILKTHFSDTGKTVSIVKIAEPLYKIQQYIYKECAKDIRYYDQDQQLLTEIANIMRRIDKESLINSFLQKIRMNDSADVIINDDIRDTAVDMPILKKEGFLILHITCAEHLRLERLSNRNDISQAQDQEPSMEYVDCTIDTSNVNDYASLYRQLIGTRILQEHL